MFVQNKITLSNVYVSLIQLVKTLYNVCRD